MASGVEFAGLALAVLPLFVSAVDAYSKGAETLWGVVIPSKSDAALHDFYCEFYYQIAVLHKQLESISNTMAGRGVVAQQGPTLTSQLDAWNCNHDMKNALTGLLGSDVELKLFEVIARKIVKLLGQLLREKSHRKFPRKDYNTDNERIMFDRLQALAADIDSHKTKSTFAERFCFFREKKDRDICLKNLGIWNRRLEKLILGTKNQLGVTLTAEPHSDTSLKTPFFRNLVSSPGIVRDATHDLYATLSSCWVCNCAAGHETRVCLNIEHAIEQPGGDIPITFDMLVSAASAQQQLMVWREGTVSFNLATSPRQDSSSRLQNICESLDVCVGGYRLRILMEHMAGHSSLWRLEPRPKRLSFLDTEPPIPLDGLLDNHFVMTRAEKCGLGLIITYSLLLFHDSPWNVVPWDKHNLSFFFKTADEPEYLRPFITTRFEQGNSEVGQTGANAFHRNYNILMLGILLIEIFMQAKIERFRTKQEREEVNPKTEANVNIKVAYRVVKKMDDAPHRAAIKACLELDWLPQGQKVLLEDLDVRKGLFANVIEPLRREQGFAA
ncbi:uncharacterized protein BDV17DRAFT_257106 [Aspergillus undulatus]|uniref:uncharacterized protein n=1 Tax=Aspergillus undulatus TaxID=1810928 RepID=UPI003CCE2832